MKNENDSLDFVCLFLLCSFFVCLLSFCLQAVTNNGQMVYYLNLLLGIVNSHTFKVSLGRSTFTNGLLPVVTTK